MWTRDASAVLFVFLLLTGCSKKKEECKQVLEVIDDDDDKIAQLTGNKGTEPEDIAKSARDVAGVCERLAIDLDALPLTTAELASCAHDYQGFSRELAASLKSYAVNLEKLGSRAEPSLRGRLEAAAKHMRTRCGDASAPVECAQLRPKVQKALQEPGKDPTAYAERLEASVADIGKLAIADADLKAGVVDVVLVLQELATAAKAEATYAVQSERLRATERQLTQKILQVCGRKR